MKPWIGAPGTARIIQNYKCIYLIELDCSLACRAAFLPPWEACWMGMQSFWKNCETFNLLEWQRDRRMTVHTVRDVDIAKAYLFCLALGQEIGCCWRSWESLIMLIQRWSPWSLKNCSFMSWALKTVWRYSFRSGNNPVPFAYWE